MTTSFSFSHKIAHTVGLKEAIVAEQIAIMWHHVLAVPNGEEDIPKYLRVQEEHIFTRAPYFCERISSTMPYLGSVRSIKTYIKRLVEAGIVLVRQLGDDPLDQTNWYAINRPTAREFPDAAEVISRMCKNCTIECAEVAQSNVQKLHTASKGDDSSTIDARARAHALLVTNKDLQEDNDTISSLRSETDHYLPQPSETEGFGVDDAGADDAPMPDQDEDDGASRKSSDLDRIKKELEDFFYTMDLKGIPIKPKSYKAAAQQVYAPLLSLYEAINGTYTNPDGSKAKTKYVWNDESIALAKAAIYLAAKRHLDSGLSLKSPQSLQYMFTKGLVQEAGVNMSMRNRKRTGTMIFQ